MDIVLLWLTINSLIIWKFIAAFIWANIWYLLNIDYYGLRQKTNIDYWPKWFIYSLTWMFWAIFLLWPSTISYSFISWIIWVITLKNFFNQHNKWAEKIEYKDKSLNEEEIKDIYNDTN